MDTQEIESRYKMAEAATELYVDDPDGFSIQKLAEKLDEPKAEIYRRFPTAHSLLRFYYTSLVFRYRGMIDEIEEFEGYNLAEKLSNFVYASFDMMLEQREFVALTFDRLIKNTAGTTEYQKEIEKLAREFFENDKNVATSSQMLLHPLLYQVLVKSYFRLIDFWLEDTSEQFEKTMALTDKATALIQEMMYSAVLDKGVDLFKYMTSNGMGLGRIPFVGSRITRWLNQS